MPSYRVAMVLGDLHLGVDPAQVLPDAMDFARTLAPVEAGHIEIVRGLPRVVIRFEASDDGEAARVGQRVVTCTDAMVVVETSRVQRRQRQRWVRLG